jgi:hypothetical protein
MQTLHAVVLIYVFLRMFLWTVWVCYGLSAEDYSDSYLLLSHLPLLLGQLCNHLGGCVFVVELVLMTAVFGSFYKLRYWILLGVLALALGTVMQLGARTQLMTVILACLILYDRLVRPIRPQTAAIWGAIMVSAFLVLGLVRSGLNVSDSLADASLASSEFESLFANVYDLSERKALGDLPELPLGFWLSDLTALVPGQLLPFAKINPSTWYCEEFYLAAAESGQGYCFGAIAESIVGWGWPDLIARGALLGLGLAWIQRYCAARPTNFWCFVFSVWMTILSYQLFRVTTLALLVQVVYRFLPVYIGVRMFEARERTGSRWSTVAVLDGPKPGGI